MRKTLERSEELPRVERQLARMAAQIHAGQSIVREALDEVRGHGAEREPIDLRGLVLEVAGGITKADHVELSVDVEGGAVAIDVRLIRQLLLNLLRNAVEAVAPAERGRVRVLARREVDDLLIVVEDDGPGIPDDVAPRLFQAFNTGKANGTGLGLAVCKRIAEAHGGSIEARALHPRGTAMRVLIPLGP